MIRETGISEREGERTMGKKGKEERETKKEIASGEENPLTEAPFPGKQEETVEKEETKAAENQEEDGSLPGDELAKQTWEKEKSELMDRLLRKQADFDNYRRISRAEREEAREYALFNFLERLLPVLDNLERALHSSRDEKVPGPYVDGLAMIQKQLIDLLAQEGVTPIEAAGEPFDPNYHHAVARVDEGEPGCVADELQKGYLYKNRVLRPAMVRVCQDEAAGPA